MLSIKPLALVAILLFISCDLKTDGYVESIGNGYKLYHGSKQVDLINDQNTLLVGDIWGYKGDDSFFIVYQKVGRQHPGDSIQYWLAKANMGSVNGPFNSMEIDSAKSKFKVSPSLVLDLVKDSVAP